MKLLNLFLIINVDSILPRLERKTVIKRNIANQCENSFLLNEFLVHFDIFDDRSSINIRY